MEGFNPDEDSPLNTQSPAPGAPRQPASRIGLTLAALGVVFGDIGTSPLYALRECFIGPRAIQPTGENVLGAISLIFWFLVIIVCIKYVVLIMRADNKGEGGIVALMALVERIGPQGRFVHSVLPLLGIVGAALIFSDGVITPAVSVLSAVEGLTVAAPFFRNWVMPLALVILCGLFMLQPRGTAKIGALFGPVLLVWFLVMGTLGAVSLVRNPAVLLAMNPWYAVNAILHNGWKSVSLLATVFLSVTGAEVLYADMGHFGKRPIRTSWFLFVFPALLLNYLGQGAYMLRNPCVPHNLFYLLSPEWFVYPLVLIATLATVIASQAVISGTFSLAKQAVQLGFWPRMRIVHTSAETEGQVYIPFVNISLFVATMLCVLGFKESGKLAGAYGIAVSAAMLITTVLALLAARHLWKVPLWVVVVVGGCFLVLHTALFSVNLVKLPSGGWVVVLISVALSVMMRTWMTGRAMLRKKVETESIPLGIFVTDIATTRPTRVPGTAVFLAGSADVVPRALLHNFKHNKVIHDHTLIATIRTMETPVVKAAERVSVTALGQGVYQVGLSFGFVETPNLPRGLALAAIPGVSLDPMQVTYFVGKEMLALTRKGGIGMWKRRVFHYMANNSFNASSFFGLPPNRVVELGLQIEL